MTSDQSDSQSIANPLVETNKMFDSTRPPLLFHYTNASALIGICSSGKLWAGRPDQMNDSTEQQYAIERLNNAASNRYQTEAWKSKEEQIFLRSLDNIDFFEVAAKKMPKFTISLTSDGDLLSQWRAYCPPSGGYSIGIPTSHLAKLCDEQNYFLANCIYDYNQVVVMVNELLDDALHSYELKVKADPSNQPKILLEEIQMLGRMIAFYGTFAKHPSFAEEQEWRLVYLDEAFKDDEIVFTPGPNGVRMYHEFKLDTVVPSAAACDPKFHLVIGPNGRQHAAAMPAYRLMSKLLGAKNFYMHHSSSTYRV